MMTKAELEALISTLEKWSLFFAVLVAIGVTGEAAVALRLFWRNRDLKTIQESEIADLGAKAAAANERAAQLELRAEAERRARLEIERANAWRSLTENQQHEIALACARFSGITIYIRSYSGDPEAWRLGREIVAALRSVHIDVQDRLGQALGEGPPIFGLRVSGPVGPTHSTELEFTQQLCQSLRGSGKLATVELQFDPAGELPEIFVGLRPPIEIKQSRNP